MNLQEFRLLSAGHALHALNSDDAIAFTRALAAHPEWQSIVDTDLATSAELGDAVHDAAPPASLRGNLLDLLDSTPQVAASPPPAGPARAAAAASPARAGRSRALWVGAFALAASLAVLATVTLGPQIFGSDKRADPATVALAEVSQAGDARAESVEVSGGGQATLHWSRGLDSAVLVAEGLPRLSGDDDFEVWLVRGDQPISVGVLDAATKPRVLAGFQPGDVVAMTVEPAGGSPTGAPTSNPIAVIPTA